MFQEMYNTRDLVIARVILPQIVNIVKDLHTGDEIERDARRLLMK